MLSDTDFVIESLRYNANVSGNRFFHPIEVRYGDLDPQGHVNNAKYLTYMEQARIAYVKALNIWKGGSFLGLGIILAEIKITFQAPITYGQNVSVGVRVVRLGNKSITMEHIIQDSDTQRIMAQATAIMVAYDYTSEESTVVPDTWRESIQNYEGLTN